MSETAEKKQPSKPSLDDLVKKNANERKCDIAWSKAGKPATLDAWRQRWIRLVIVPREKANLDQQLADKKITQAQFDKRVKALVKDNQQSDG